MYPSTSILPLDEWQILFHEAMAAILRAKEAVTRSFGWWGILNGLWRCHGDLKALNAALKAISEAPDGYLSEEDIESQLPQLRKLLRSIEELIDTGKRHGLMNRTLTSGVLGAINLRGRYIAEYLEGLEMSLDPEVLKAIEDGRAQIESGEFEVMERLF